ncbi:hypothetical protein OCGS_1451 [Oceaniovalibus guishaninsula JLT2003]|uniref:Uncharacterized protein n=1 Tax=Oceaniovalibus guishaninsula JLT2003 TaxID=1231392 RepID=K2HAT5_9RHOB|nr:hypothetical protein [Oceaniovalibus guishaninsula]EKE44613.1 hypothetical protein OCGS_1451 [Oceaniovalibus guishaninsula JLT2003]
MSQIVENWAEIVGILLAILPAPHRADFVELHVRVEEVRRVDDWPLMLSGAEPDLAIMARRGQVDGCADAGGQRIRLRVRAEGPPPLTWFAHPGWRLD